MLSCLSWDGEMADAGHCRVEFRPAAMDVKSLEIFGIPSGSQFQFPFFFIQSQFLRYLITTVGSATIFLN